MHQIGSPSPGLPSLLTGAAVVDDNEKFCANPRCILHVAPTDANVEGRGDWAELPNGQVFARARVADRFLCHVCAEDPDNPQQSDLFSRLPG